MRYEVKKGNHDFHPNLTSQFWPVTRSISEVITLGMDPNCWYNTCDVAGGKSWNKAGGIGGWLFENNKNAVLLAWRPDDSINQFVASLYVNDKEGKWLVVKEVYFGIDETAILAYERKGSKGSMEFKLFTVDARTGDMRLPEAVDYTWDNPPAVLRRRGPWFGGRFPAYQDMTKWVSFNKLKNE